MRVPSRSLPCPQVGPLTCGAAMLVPCFTVCLRPRRWRRDCPPPPGHTGLVSAESAEAMAVPGAAVSGFCRPLRDRLLVVETGDERQPHSTGAEPPEIHLDLGGSGDAGEGEGEGPHPAGVSHGVVVELDVDLAPAPQGAAPRATAGKAASPGGVTCTVGHAVQNICISRRPRWGSAPAWWARSTMGRWRRC
jgi:hypothetical protein